MKEVDQFWMCYVDGGGAPTHKHSQQALAMAEAERLSGEKGQRVFVLKAEIFCERSPNPLSWFQTIKTRIK